MSLFTRVEAKAVRRPHPHGQSVSRASFSVVAALFLLLSTSLAVGVANQLHRLTPAALGNYTRPKYLVLIVLDGAQPSVFSEQNLPHLDALRNGGTLYDQAWAGILESETPSGHAALATGSTPARDGLLGFNWIKSDNDAVRLFDPTVVAGGAIERVMQDAGAPTIAGLFKHRYPKAKVAAISGHKYYAADPLGGPAADYIMYYQGDAKNRYVPVAIPRHTPPAEILNDPSLIWPNTSPPPGGEDDLAIRLAIHTFQRVRQQVTLINLPEFDWPLGHVDGADPVKTEQLMQAFDASLGKLEDAYRKAGVLNQTLFVITADHGMAPLRFQIPDSVLDNAVTQAGTTSPETTYSTAGFIWLQDPSKAQAVANNVVATKDPHVQSVYYKVPGKSGDVFVPAGGQPIGADVDRANQVLLQSFLGGNAPDVVAFCTEDAAFVTKGAESWKGNHGGGAWNSQHIPLLFSGAGVVAGAVSHAPARLEDIAPTALALMGVKPSGMQGVVLADALLQPSGAEKRAQSTISRQLAPAVRALAAQSLLEVAAETKQESAHQ